MPELPIEISGERIPGAAPVSAHSAFAALENAAVAPARVIALRRTSASRSHCRAVSLNGEWRRRALEADPAALPLGADFDDSEWDRVPVPNNYGLEAALSAHFGPVFYRCRLAPIDAPRVRLRFDAADYYADVWLDERHLGRHVGYFAPFEFDVTDLVRASCVLTVRVQDPFEDWWAPDQPFYLHPKRAIKGTLKYHDSRPGGLPGVSTPGWTPRLAQSLTTGGITGAVSLRATGDVRIDALFATPIDWRTGAVHIAIVMSNDSGRALDATAEFSLARERAGGEPHRCALAVALRPGANRVDARITVANPRPWWPASHADLGGPELYRIGAELIVNGAVSDRRAERFGIRVARVAGDPRRMTLNGRPIFVQAANYIPRQHFADADVEFYRRDMRLAAAAHLNSFGVHGHVQCPCCYHAADEEGILIFQDFALQWHYDSGRETNPGFNDTASRQIAEMAYTYWNHPSIVYWACHNEPTAMFIPDRPADEARDPDNQVLDEALERRLLAIEPMRHVHRASGIGDDLHMYDGSLSGGEVYGVRRHRAWFVSEYGFWTLGPQAHRWNDQGWPPDEFQMRNWLSRLSFGPATMMFAGLPERYPTFEAWRRATEEYGAFLAKYQTEWMRLNRGASFNAIRWHFFVDWWGWAGGGLLDVDRKAKATYVALRTALRPVLVATSLERTVFAPGNKLEFPIGAVNETRGPVRLDVRWRWRRRERSLVIGVDTEVNNRYIWSRPRGSAMVALPWGSTGATIAEGALAGSVAPESAASLGVLHLALPRDELASATLELEWNGGETNWYHVLAARDGWFCGPGAFVVGPTGAVRLGANEA